MRISNSFKKREIVIFGDQFQSIIDNIDNIDASINEIMVCLIKFFYYNLKAIYLNFIKKQRKPWIKEKNDIKDVEKSVSDFHGII